MIIDANVHPFTWKVLEAPLDDRDSAGAVRRGVQATAHGKRVVYPALFSADPVDCSDALVADLEVAGVDFGVILPTIYNIRSEFVAQMVRRYPDRLSGFGKWHSSDLAQGTSSDAIRHAILDLGLAGIGEEALSEFYPVVPTEIPRLSVFVEIMDTISALAVPIVFDSGFATTARPLRYYDPLVVDDIACEFPEATLIINHAGKNDPIFARNARLTARRHANVYLEISYQSAESITTLVREVGADRLIFGSDWSAFNGSNAMTIRRQIQAVMDADISDEDREFIFSRTILSIAPRLRARREK